MYCEFRGLPRVQHDRHKPLPDVRGRRVHGVRRGRLRSSGLYGTATRTIVLLKGSVLRIQRAAKGAARPAPPPARRARAACARCAPRPASFLRTARTATRAIVLLMGCVLRIHRAAKGAARPAQTAARRVTGGVCTVCGDGYAGFEPPNCASCANRTIVLIAVRAWLRAHSCGTDAGYCPSVADGSTPCTPCASPCKTCNSSTCLTCPSGTYCLDGTTCKSKSDMCGNTGTWSGDCSTGGKCDDCTCICQAEGGGTCTCDPLASTGCICP